MMKILVEVPVFLHWLLNVRMIFYFTLFIYFSCVCVCIWAHMPRISKYQVAVFMFRLAGLVLEIKLIWPFYAPLQILISVFLLIRLEKGVIVYICDSRGVRDIYEADGSNTVAASEPLAVLVSSDPNNLWSFKNLTWHFFELCINNLTLK